MYNGDGASVPQYYDYALLCAMPAANTGYISHDNHFHFSPTQFLSTTLVLTSLLTSI